MGSRQTGSRPPLRDIRVDDPEALAPLSAAAVRRVVTAVLDGERVSAAAVSVTFLSGAKMRGLNRRTLARDRSTDVIAFELPHPQQVVGDVYICPATARRRCDPAVPEREEMIRLIVHGTLHVLGYEHPNGPNREASPMWRQQERYVSALTDRTP